MNQPPSSQGSGYEDILRDTLLQRTGRRFTRNIDAAIVPQQKIEPRSKEETAEMIFDNILRKREAQAKAEAEAEAKRKAEEEALTKALPADANHPSAVSPSYGDILDELLWPSQPESQTISENTPPPTPNAPPDYKAAMRKTLMNRTKAEGDNTPGLRRSFLRSSRPDDTATPAAEKPSPTSEPEPVSPSDPYLTRTMYERNLDDMLWPVPPGAPPVSEEKIRALCAEYLQNQMRVDTYGNLSLRRKFLEDKYAVRWLEWLLPQVIHSFRNLASDFHVWQLWQQSDLWLHIIPSDFVSRHGVILERLLPKKKTDRLVIRSVEKEDEGLLADRIGQFEDVRRLLRNADQPIQTDDIRNLVHFLKRQLPDVIRSNQESVRQLIQESSAFFPDSHLRDLLTDLLLAPRYLEWLAAAEESESMRNQARRRFLQDRIPTLAHNSEPFLGYMLLLMDLLLERSHLFPERDMLPPLFELLEQYLRLMPEAGFNWPWAQEYSQLAQAHATAFQELAQEVLQPLERELQRTSQQVHRQWMDMQQHAHRNYLAQATPEQKQAVKGRQITYDVTGAPGQAQLDKLQQRHQKLQALFERHQQQLVELQRKRLTLLYQWDQADPGSHAARQACQERSQQVQRHLRASGPRAHYPSLRYRIPDPARTEALAAQLRTTYRLNSSEESALEQAFQRCDHILQALNQSRSTARLNLYQLFSDQPDREICQALIQDALGQLAEIRQFRQDELGSQLDNLLGVYGYFRSGQRAPEEILDHWRTQDAFTRAGYLLAYFAHAEYLKLFVDNQYQQITFDFHTLFDIAQALLILEMAIRQPHLDNLSLWRATLLRAWDCVQTYVLTIGESQYNLVYNPLSLFAYSYEEEFTPNPVVEPISHRANEVAFPKPSPVAKSVQPVESFSLQSLGDDEEEAPPPLKPSRPAPLDDDEPRRRIPPSSSGKFAMYGPPRTRSAAPPAAVSLEEDDLYRLMGQTVSAPTPAPVAPPLPPSTPPSPPEPVPTKKSDRDRWLELTPGPVPTPKIDDPDGVIGELLSSKAFQTPSPRKQETFVGLAEDILRRNQLDASAPLDSGQTIQTSQRLRNLLNEDD